jgi:hypothetical protein
MNEYLRAKDTISGKDGEASIKINGNVYYLFSCKKIEAKIKKTKADIKVIGARGTQKKAGGYEGTGTLDVYDVSSMMRRLMIQYMKTGKDFFFDLTIRNNDESSSFGAQTVTLFNCNLDEIVLAQLDAESDALEASYPFTFEDADLGEEFSNSNF